MCFCTVKMIHVLVAPHRLHVSVLTILSLHASGMRLVCVHRPRSYAEHLPDSGSADLSLQSVIAITVPWYRPGSTERVLVPIPLSIAFHCSPKLTGPWPYATRKSQVCPSLHAGSVLVLAPSNMKKLWRRRRSLVSRSPSADVDGPDTFCCSAFAFDASLALTTHKMHRLELLGPHYSRIAGLRFISPRRPRLSIKTAPSRRCI
ncbi:hypothetical protein PLICRDRAFT_687955 [Plicaturopsis crispa FD-325 SS-3]|nr:hypothetical protein PLICRDRAFT_687955 [Plicaturopsis crispa FD-325 SS-3]